MNFYKEQDSARRKSFHLYFVFFLTMIFVCMTTSLAYFGLLCCFHFFSPEFREIPNLQFTVETLLNISAGMMVYILIGSIFQWLDLSSGGKVVAESLGGKPLLHNTENFEEKQLLNIVEEMSLASSVPMPEVYLLPEKGINAFAAGLTINDAVIGVTQGALNYFDREAMQGVIGHEFSHILNGDIRINAQLISFVSPLTAIARAGNYLTEIEITDAKNNKNFLLVGAGLGLWVIGSFGALVASVVKSAISRQREFLADASAVQFTRNKMGLAKALKTIGGFQYGSKIRHHNALNVSHMFFSSSMASYLSSHPPLEVRIKKLEPGWGGAYPQIELLPEDAKEKKFEYKPRKLVEAIASAILLPPVLEEASKEPYYARAMVLLLLLKVDDKPMKLTEDAKSRLIKADAGLAFDFFKLLKQSEKVSIKKPFLVLQKLVPNFKSLSIPQREALVESMQIIKTMDGVVTLMEWAMVEFVFHILDPKSRGEDGSDKEDGSLENMTSKLLHFFVIAGNQNDETRARAFNKAATASTNYRMKFDPELKPSEKEVIFAIKFISNLSFRRRNLLIRGLVSAALKDDDVNSMEHGLLMAISSIWGVVLPKTLKMPT